MSLIESELAKSIIFIPAAVDEAGLTPQEFRIYVHLARLDGKGIEFPSVENMARACRMNKDTVWAALKALGDRGLILRMSSAGKASKYQLTQPGSWRIEGQPTPPLPLASQSTSQPIEKPAITANEKAVAEIWNEIAELKGLAKAQEWTEARRKMVRARIKDYGLKFLENFKLAAKACSESEWAVTNKANLEHCLRPENFQRYLDAARTEKAPQSEAGDKPARILPDFVIRKIAGKNSELEQAKRQLRKDEADKGKDSGSAQDTRRRIARLEAEIAELES